jgi:hypothetical protein
MIVILSLLEITIFDSKLSAVNAFKVVRLLKALRVLRITKVF